MKLVEKKVKEMVAKQLGVRVEKIIPESRFKEDLGADSLDMIDLLMEVEREFKLNIPDEDAEKMLKTGDVIFYIENKTAIKL